MTDQQASEVPVPRLRALALNCTLKPSPSESSTDLMLDQLAGYFSGHAVDVEKVRVADYEVKPGVTKDEGNGDQWPQLRQRMLNADILIVGTPVWMGSPSSIAKRIAERLDAELSEIDDKGRYSTFGKVAVVAVVGNEDGAHHVSAELYQWLNDVGFSIPAAGVTYWVGEAMQGTDFKDLDATPDKVVSTQKMVASNAAHLARLLKGSPYSGVSS